MIATVGVAGGGRAARDVVAALRAAGCVFAEDEARLLLAEADGPADLARRVAQRVRGVPLEHVLGWAELGRRRVQVDPGVFVPRRRSELLVDQAVALTPPGAVVLDLCCGSGALGAAVAGRVPGVTLYAADLDPAAVRCARRNVEPLGGTVFAGDLYAPLPEWLRGRVDTLVVNAPYVPTAAIPLLPPEARDHEPLVALDGGADGLQVQRRVVASAAAWLSARGHLLLETSAASAPGTLGLCAAAGLAGRVVRCDATDATVLVGRLVSRRARPGA